MGITATRAQRRQLERDNAKLPATLREVPRDEWLFPNINTGCVLKFNEQGEVLETLWDLGGENHPMITSMREHRGHLYLGGIMNNRIGRYTLSDADPDFVQYDRRWGKAA